MKRIRSKFISFFLYFIIVRKSVRTFTNEFFIFGRNSTSNIVVVALEIAVAFISLGLISYAATAQTTHENNVTIPAGASMKPENGFEPKTINVKAGQIVTWKNMDNSLHTVISGTGLNDPNNGKAFDSGLTSLIPGKSWSHQFIKAGTFPYFCELHPAMTGLVIVS